jgi:hypothetical protein
MIDRLGAEVEAQLGRFGTVGEMARVVAAWPEAVGARIAAHAWPARLARDGTLHVATDSSAWAFELAQLALVMLERMHERLPETALSGLRFSVGPVPEFTAETARAVHPPPPQPTAEDRELARSLTAGLADEELRELVARAAAASLARAAADR